MPRARFVHNIFFTVLLQLAMIAAQSRVQFADGSAIEADKIRKLILSVGARRVLRTAVDTQWVPLID